MTVDLRPLRLDLADMQILCNLLEFDRKPHEPLRTAEARLEDRTVDGCSAMGSVAEIDGIPVGVTTLMKPPGDVFPDTIGIWVVVHPEHRRQGIGRRLAGAEMAQCIEAGFPAQLTAVSLDEAPGLALAEATGFREIDRGWQLTFDIDTWDSTAGEQVLQAAHDDGVEVLSLANLARKRDGWAACLHPLAHECAGDVPTTMDLPSDDMVGATPDAFEVKLQTLRIDMDASFVAMVDGNCAATSWITRPTDEVCCVTMTGTGRAYRRRGLVKALKQAAFKWCSSHGVRWINTQQHESNMPMLDLNKRLGFKVQHGHAIMRRDLAD